MTGKQIGNVHRESSASERTEAAADRKAAQKKGNARKDTGSTGSL